MHPSSNAPKREINVTFNRVRTPNNSGTASSTLHRKLSIVIFMFCVLVTAVMAFFALNIVFGTFRRTSSNSVPVMQQLPDYTGDESSTEYGYVLPNQLEENVYDAYQHYEISDSPPMEVPYQEEQNLEPQRYYGLGAAVELYPFLVTVEEVFVIDYEHRSWYPDYGNVFVGIVFVFENITDETQNLWLSQVEVFLDGFYVSHSSNASMILSSRYGIESISGSLSGNRSMRVQHGIEIPAATLMIEVEVNAGGFSQNREIVLFKLDIPVY